MESISTDKQKKIYRASVYYWVGGMIFVLLIPTSFLEFQLPFGKFGFWILGLLSFFRSGFLLRKVENASIAFQILVAVACFLSVFVSFIFIAIVIPFKLSNHLM